jgi:hypothetical protein
VELLLLKLTLTPLLIGGASLAARRWGPSVGGWITALPLTSGPVTLYLALDRGSTFATSAARGSLAALLGDAAFGLTYGWLARRHGWQVSLLGGFGAFGIVTVLLSPAISAPLFVLFIVVDVGMIVLLRMAPPAIEALDPGPMPAWDIPARIVVGTTAVLTITAIADALGPQLSGVIAALPLYVSVLAVFAHQLEGPEHALGVVRGLQIGLFGTTVFFLIVITTLEPMGPVVAFTGGLAAVAIVQSISLRVLRRSIPVEIEVP